MLWLAILVMCSPVLVFKGLTLETLWQFFNVHPFWFMATLSVLFSKGRNDIIMDKLKKFLDTIEIENED